MTAWAFGYMNMSSAWIMIGVFAFLANEEYKKVKDAKRSFARDAAVNERKAITARVEELPSWVSEMPIFYIDVIDEILYLQIFYFTGPFS